MVAELWSWWPLYQEQQYSLFLLFYNHLGGSMMQQYHSADVQALHTTTCSIWCTWFWIDVKMLAKVIACQKCETCLHENCGNCTSCQDMQEFGGFGCLGRICMLRECGVVAEDNRKRKRDQEKEKREQKWQKKKMLSYWNAKTIMLLWPKIKRRSFTELS